MRVGNMTDTAETNPFLEALLIRLWGEKRSDVCVGGRRVEFLALHCA